MTKPSHSAVTRWIDRSFVRLRAVVLLCSVAGTLSVWSGLQPAWAQTVGGGSRSSGSNWVFIGQTGNTNTAGIDQVGAGNVVGGMGETLRLNQMGDDNVVTIRQIGENNSVGSLDLVGSMGPLTGREGVASGLYQLGDRNELDITQRTFRGPGSNLLGAIRQEAGEGAMTATNRAVVEQVGGAFEPNAGGPGTSSGAGRHQIGEIAQTHRSSGTNADPNVIDVRQIGSQAAVWQLRQDGSGNAITLRQGGEVNSLRIAGQTGTGNDLLLQQTGTQNTLGNTVQTGDSNRTEVRIDGTGNFVDQIVQAGLGGIGAGLRNMTTISISGDDNGGDGIGGYGTMSAQGGTMGAYAASFEQYGDDNGFRLTVGSDATGRADANLYSARQSGNGNQVAAAMTGDLNTLMLVQTGDGNVFDIDQSGTSGLARGGQGAGLRASVEQNGDRNLLQAWQRGASNDLDVRIAGDDNDGSTRQGGFVQDGSSLSATLDVMGSGNLVSMRQTGANSTAAGRIVGSGNAAYVLQAGQENDATYVQFGRSNYIRIQQ